MGLFSSSHTYNAYASTSALFDEDERPDTLKAMLLQSMIGSTATMTEAIKITLQTNLYARGRSMIRYANREYIHGLPTTSQPSINVYESDVDAAIEREIGEAVDMVFVHWGGFRDEFFVEAALDEFYLDPNYFPWPSGNPLNDWERTVPSVEIPVVDPDAVDPDSPYYYTGRTDYNFIQTDPSGLYQVTYDYTDNLGNPQTWAVADTFSLPQALTNDWITAVYKTEADPDTSKYWSYQIGSDIDPILEAAIVRSSLTMQYMPVAILMHDKVWWDDANPPDDDPLQLTTHRLLRRLALDSYEIKEEFLLQQEEDDEENDENKSNAEIWDFFIHFTVPMRSNVRGSREYLFHFWKFIEDNGTWTDFDDYQAFIGGSGAEQPSSNMHITEGDETSYHLYYAWSYIHAVTHDGRYEVNGIPMRANHTHSDIYEFGTAGYNDGIEEVHGPGTPIALSEPEGQYHDYAVFTQQNQNWITGEWTYEQVLVMAPSMMYVINTSEEGDFRQRYVNVELFPEDPDLRSEFRIPVHIGSLKDVAVMHREEMLGDALSATVFLVEDVKVKWYQKGFMKWLIILVVVIIVVLFWYTGVLPALAIAAGAAVGATALALWALYVVLVFALGFLISFAGALMGGWEGRLFILLASIAIGGKGAFSNLGSSWGKLMTAPGYGTAVTFITTVSPYMNFAMTVYQDIILNKLEDDMRDFLQTAREKQEILQDAWDSMGPLPTWLDPMDLIRVQSETVIETPGNFFNRSLNANPGLLGYDLIENFSEIALMLPKDGTQNTITDSLFNELAKQRGAV